MVRMMTAARRSVAGGSDEEESARFEDLGTELLGGGVGCVLVLDDLELLETLTDLRGHEPELVDVRHDLREEDLAEDDHQRVRGCERLALLDVDADALPDLLEEEALVH